VTDVFRSAGALAPAYRKVDWAATGLGPPDQWTPTLRQAVDLALNTRFAVTLFWGPDFIMIYNEAYASMIGDKHPAALGAPAAHVFSEVWDTIGPMIAAVRRGEGATWSADLPLTLRRQGFAEECYFTFSYSAVTGDDAVIEGVIDIAAETTAQVVSQRRLLLLSRLRSALDDPDCPEAVIDAALGILNDHQGDIRQARIERIDPRTDARLAGTGFTTSMPDGGFVARCRLEAASGSTEMLVLTIELSHTLAVDEPYLEFVRLLGANIGQALERLRVRDAARRAATVERQMSETLQLSLLTAPVRTAGVDVAVRYQTAAAQAQVGGDWYDSFLLPDGTLTVVIGDVAGHDRFAAAGMAQIRNLLRGIAYAVEKPPGLLLSLLDDAMRGLQVDCFATAILARVEQGSDGGRTLRWSNAGHPPPILLAPDGATTVLATDPDPLLGAAIDLSRRDHTIGLEPGASIVFYTDGCVERPGIPIHDGIMSLADRLSGLRYRSASDLADGMLAGVDHHDDDIAILALHVQYGSLDGP